MMALAVCMSASSFWLLCDVCGHPWLHEIPENHETSLVAKRSQKFQSLRSAESTPGYTDEQGYLFPAYKELS